MNALRRAICVVLLSACVSAGALAQPLFTVVHDWTIDARIGLIGYREVRQEPGGYRHGYLFLGPAGSVRVNKSAMPAIAILACAAGIAFAVALTRLGQRRIRRNSRPQ